jgi:hypothetical protein
MDGFRVRKRVHDAYRRPGVAAQIPSRDVSHRGGIDVSDGDVRAGMDLKQLA